MEVKRALPMRGSHWTCTGDFISYLDTGVLRRFASKEVFCSCGVHRANLEALKEEGEGEEGGGEVWDGADWNPWIAGGFNF